MIKLGYLKEKNKYDLDDENLKSLTHINLSFAKVVDKSGNVEFEVLNEEKLLLFLEQNPKIKVSIAVGGWGAVNFSDAALTESNRNTFAQTTLSIVEKYDLDGVDLDWEYPCCSDSGIVSRPEDKQNFTKMMKILRTQLDALSEKTGKKYELTFAAGAQKKLVDCVELEELSKITDFMNLMTYDMCGSFGTTAHHASLYPSEICDAKGGAYFVDLYDKYGYPKEKIVLGAAFYGRGGNGVNQINSPIKGEEGLYFDYHQIKEMISAGEMVEYYDNIAKAAYCLNDDTFITYENTDSIKAKLEYVVDKKLAGIMFWEYATDETGELLNVVINYK